MVPPGWRCRGGLAPKAFHQRNVIPTEHLPRLRSAFSKLCLGGYASPDTFAEAWPITLLLTVPRIVEPCHVHMHNFYSLFKYFSS